MAPQVVQYPRATSLTAHSSRATGVEVAAWAASLIAAPVGETFFAQHEAYLALCETKFALLTQKRRIWGVLRALGEFCHAYAANQLSRASLISPERCTAAAQQRSRKAQEGLAAVPAGGGEARPDNEPTRRATHQRPGTTGVEAAGGSGGPGWASRRRITTQHRRRRRCGGRRRVRRAQEGLAAVPVGGGGARPGFEPTHRTMHQHRRRRRCGGRRRVRRARAGFEIDHSEFLGSRVAISRAAGPDGARNTIGAASTAGDQARLQAPLEIRTPRSTPGSGRPGGRRGARAR